MNQPAFNPALKSQLAQVDAHSVQPSEYDELPELTDAMLARAVRVIDKGGRRHPTQPPKDLPHA